jgi:hypothetical protein
VVLGIMGLGKGASNGTDASLEGRRRGGFRTERATLRAIRKLNVAEHEGDCTFRLKRWQHSILKRNKSL